MAEAALVLMAMATRELAVNRPMPRHHRLGTRRHGVPCQWPGPAQHSPVSATHQLVVLLHRQDGGGPQPLIVPATQAVLLPACTARVERGCLPQLRRLRPRERPAQAASRQHCFGWCLASRSPKFLFTPPPAGSFTGRSSQRRTHRHRRRPICTRGRHTIRRRACRTHRCRLERLRLDRPCHPSHPRRPGGARGRHRMVRCR